MKNKNRLIENIRWMPKKIVLNLTIEDITTIHKLYGFKINLCTEHNVNSAAYDANAIIEKLIGGSKNVEKRK